jgi:type IV pilus assembly protein PilB
MSFVDYLIQQNVLSKDDDKKIRKASNDPELTADEALKNILAEKNIDEKELLSMRASYHGIPFKHVDADEIPVDILKNIPEEAALHYEIVPLGIKDGVLDVGVLNPDNIAARDALQFIASRLGLTFEMFLITRESFDALLSKYQGLTQEVHKALGELEGELSREESVRKRSKRGRKDARGETQLIEETPVTKIVAVMLRHATEGNASDIHIEHTGSRVRVRFRVDGVLHTSLYLPPSIHSAVVGRIKVLSRLRLDERRKPQDGSFSANIEQRKIDFRVSTFPSSLGEKVVIRILDPTKGIKSIEETGLTKKGREIVRRALARPYGLILLTGPTGSGKTTTLYAMINELDMEGRNVVSLEDPVEYNIEGMSQSQVRPEIGYTFANGLRSVLRQDPDVIMVGEIRDKETAHLAIHAALTGHLVFSTLHTNNVAGVIPRLIDMDVDPYLIASTLILAVAQRLTRRLCEGSKKEVPIEGAVKALLENHIPKDSPERFRELVRKQTKVYDAEPSAECPQGTQGRIGLYELFEADKEMEGMILNKPTEDIIIKEIRKKGGLLMVEDALIKVYQGIIPYRAISEFE